MLPFASLVCRRLSRNPLSISYRLSSSSSAVRVIFEDDCCLVADKPPLTHSQPGNLANNANILDDLKAHIRQSRPDTVKNIYLGSCNRLDFQVGGCMLFAKTERASRDMNEQFRDRTVEKVYYAITHDSPYLRSAEEHYLEHNYEGKGIASLYYSLEQRVIVKKMPCALVRVRLLTGFKHQVRVMVSSCLGAPVVGDTRYGSSVNLDGQLLLHAHALSFDHPKSGVRLSFSSPLPALWRRLTKVELKHRGI